MLHHYCARTNQEVIHVVLFVAALFLSLLSLASSLRIPLGISWRNNGTLPTAVGELDGKYRVVNTDGSLNYTLGFVATLPPDYSRFTFSVLALQNYSRHHRIVQGTASVIWSANRDLLVGDGALLQLGLDGNLVLHDFDGRQAWASNTARQGVTGMELLPSGNLVLTSRHGIVWQSFDLPTDVLMPGQSLSVGSRLVSSVSPSDRSPGKYSLVIDPDGVYLYASSPFDGLQPYFGPGFGGRPGVLRFFTGINVSRSQYLLPGGSDCFSLIDIGAVYSQNNSLVLREHWNVSRCNISHLTLDTRAALSLDSFGAPFVPCIAPVIGCYLKLDPDGDLRQYEPRVSRTGMTWNSPAGSDLLSAAVNDSSCLLPDQCGPYGVCSAGACSCPHNSSFSPDSLFRFVNPSVPQSGCTLSRPLGDCSMSNQQTLLEVNGVAYFTVGNSHFTGRRDRNVTMEFCKQTCLQNCSCRAVFVTTQAYSSSRIGGETSCYYTPELAYGLKNISSEGNQSVLFSAFFKVHAPVILSQVSPPAGLGSSHRTVTKLAGVISSGVFVLLILVFVLALYLFHKRRLRLYKASKEAMLLAARAGLPPKFSYKELKAATGNFGRKLGSSVFEGVLTDGSKVAVKQLELEHHAVKEVRGLVANIAGIQHYNLVRLRGFCQEGVRLLLVYELVPNGSLDSWLFWRHHEVAVLDHLDSTSEQREATQVKLVPVLPWNVRFNICLGIARGLLHLHEGCGEQILHLDIRSENVLLEVDFTPKVSGFGLSSLKGERSCGSISSRKGGAYQAPELLLHAAATAAMDVYSYGMVLLEIISGRRNLEVAFDSSKAFFPSWAFEQVELDKHMDLVDARLEGLFDHYQAEKLIHIALWCIQESPKLRPRMRFVLEMLEGQEKIPKAPSSLHVALQNPGELFDELGSGFSMEKLDIANFDQNSDVYDHELELSDVELLMSRDRSDD